MTRPVGVCDGAPVTVRRSVSHFARISGEPDLDARHISAELVRFLFESVARSGAESAVPAAWTLHVVHEMGRKGAATFSRTHIASAYKAAMMKLQNHACALEGKVPISYDEFDMLCYCIISCSTLRDAIRRAERFFAMIETRKVSIELEEEGGQAAFSMHTNRARNTLATFLLDLSGLAYFYQLFSWLVGQPLPLLATCMAYEKPLASPAIVTSIFGHPIHFDRSTNKLTFPAAFLDRPVARTAQDLAVRLGQVSFDIMPSQWASARLSDQLAAIFRSALARNAPLPKLTEAARLLNQSEATLRRRLADENVSARAIKETCLLETSVEYLKDTRTTVEEISTRLRFSSSSSFRRAFKQWTGQSPSEYRATRIEGRAANAVG